MKEAPDTKGRLLDVAEELFAREGIDRVSVRDITEAARANLGAINYHFGGKEALIEAVFDRRIAPVNEARVAALDAVETKGVKNSPAVERILEAFIRPAVTACIECEGGGSFALLFGRCMAESHPQIEAYLQSQFAPLASRFQKALQKALPHLSAGEIFWRLKFTFGALHHFLLTRDKFCPKGVEKTTSEEQMTKLIKFAAAGFKAK